VKRPEPWREHANHGFKVNPNPGLRVTLARAAVGLLLDEFQWRRDSERELLRLWSDFALERRYVRRRAVGLGWVADKAAERIALRSALARWLPLLHWAPFQRSASRLLEAARADAVRSALVSLWQAAQHAAIASSAHQHHALRTTWRCLGAWQRRARAGLRRDAALEQAERRAILAHLQRALATWEAMARATATIERLSACAGADVRHRQMRGTLRRVLRTLSAPCRRRRAYETISHAMHSTAVWRAYRMWHEGTCWNVRGGVLEWLGGAAARTSARRGAFARWRARGAAWGAWSHALEVVGAMHVTRARRLVLRKLVANVEAAAMQVELTLNPLDMYISI